MIGWLRSVFAHRKPDPELDQHRALRVELSAQVTSTSSRAKAVAATVISDSSPSSMRASFGRAERRLGGERRR